MSLGDIQLGGKLITGKIFWDKTRDSIKVPFLTIAYRRPRILRAPVYSACGEDAGGERRPGCSLLTKALSWTMPDTC